MRFFKRKEIIDENSKKIEKIKERPKEKEEVFNESCFVSDFSEDIYNPMPEKTFFLSEAIREEEKKIREKRNNESVTSIWGGIRSYFPSGDVFIISGSHLKEDNDVFSVCEVLTGIKARAIEDMLSAGYGLFPIKENPSQIQLERWNKFFEAPNDKETGEEWLENSLTNLFCVSNIFWEIVGSKGNRKRRIQGGETVYDLYDNDKLFDGNKYKGKVLNVEPWTMSILTDGKKIPDPPSPAYKWSGIDGSAKFLTKRKIIHISKNTNGSFLGNPLVRSGVEVINAFVKLTTYTKELNSGKIPKKLFCFPGISEKELKRVMNKIKQAKSGLKEKSTGILVLNPPVDANLKDLTADSLMRQLLDFLKYYREEISSIFGMPPKKMGWYVEGTIGGTVDHSVDTWYDVVESHHRKLEFVINTKILPLLGIKDYVFKFISPRPSKMRQTSETVLRLTRGLWLFFTAGVLSPREVRDILRKAGLDLKEVSPDVFPDIENFEYGTRFSQAEPNSGVNRNLITTAEREGENASERD